VTAPWRVRWAEASLEAGALQGRLVNQPAVGPVTRAGALEVQALVIDGGGLSRRLVLVMADVIWFADDSARRLRREIARIAGCDEAGVALAASHTHGTPQTDPRFGYGEYDAAFVRGLEDQVLATVSAALAHPAKVVSLSYGSCPVEPSVAVNRRRVAWHLSGRRLTRRVQNLPNRAAPCDNRARVLAFAGADGVLAGVLVHFACHPVCDPPGCLGPDYPGAMRTALRARLPEGAFVGFLQGSCGDVRPDLAHTPRGLKDHVVEAVIGQRFRPARAGDAEALGCALADAAARALTEAAAVDGGEAAAATEPLPLYGVSGRALDRALDVAAWRIGTLGLAFAGAEMLSGLASPDARVFSVGYANGMAGYVAPASAYAGGGYEIDGFLERFAIPERLASDSADRYAALRDRLLAADAVRSPARAAS
jgi:hypothetical protein